MTKFIPLLGLSLSLAGICLAGWLPIDSITNRTTSDLTCQSNARAVACDAAGDIHVVWRGRVAGVFQVWYSRRDVGSGQWTPDTMVTNVAGGVCDPACALGPDQALYVAWNDSLSGQLQLLERDASGLWTRLDSLSGRQGDSMVAVTIDGSGTLHAVWSRGTAPTNVICYANHSGSGWSRVDTVTQPGSRGSWPAITCASADSIMVVWSEAASPYRILARQRVRGDWRSEEVVYADRAATPAAAWGADSFYVAWLSGSSPNQRVLVRTRSRFGWSDTTRLNLWRVGARGVAIGADEDGALHVVWSGNDSASPNYNQIQYRARPARDTWQGQQHLTQGPANARERTSLSSGEGRAQVLWSEQPATNQAYVVRLRRYERVHDVGVLRIAAPRDTVDSGTVVRPQAWVKNYGDQAETNVPARLWFGSYQSQRFVPVLVPGETSQVTFDADTVAGRGWVAVTCSTSLAGDTNRGNDAARGSFFVRVQDVAAVAIVAPEDTTEADSLVPLVRVRNLGNVEAQAGVHGWIVGTTYHGSVALRLGPERDTLVALRPWATELGTFVFRCSVAYAPDVHPENNMLSREFVVVQRDAGVLSILSPSGTVDSGVVVTPRALVRNHGTRDVSFSVRLLVGAAYCDTAFGVSLAPSRDTTVEFQPWRATVRWMQTVRCSTMLEGDWNPGNDAQRCSVSVRVCDATVLRILHPVGMIGRGEVRPRVRLANRGTQTDEIPAKFEIVGEGGRVYLDSATATLGAGDSTEMEFAPWQARSGKYTGICVTTLAGDMQPGNDTQTQEFRLAARDVAALRIQAPRDTVSEGRIGPRVRVANLGDSSATFFAHFRSESQGSVVYHDSVPVALDTTEIREVAFREWLAGPGDYRVTARVVLADDENSSNDTVSGAVYVESLASRNWREYASLPLGPWARRVKDGGSLVAVSDGLLALKGANTLECYQYLVGADSWTGLALLPAGVAGHRVRAGAALCWDGASTVYALKGTGTREFWRYDIAGDSWRLLAGLPEHTRGARYGTGLVFLSGRNTDRVFMVKGSGTRDFLVYWVQEGEWHARRPVPPGADSTLARHGTCLVRLGERVFCLKGGTTEFYEYFPEADSWHVRASLPRLGRGNQWKRPTKGAALTSDGSRFLYAFKGGRCNEFWRYDSRADSWIQFDDIPTGRYRRKVGRGGALAAFAGRIYALKGGGTNELWCFDPLASAVGPARRAGVDAVEEDDAPLLAAGPGSVVVRCGQWAEQPVLGATGETVVVDALGRVVTPSVSTRTGPRLRFRRPGIYFVLTAGGTGSSVVKAVVLR